MTAKGKSRVFAGGHQPHRKHNPNRVPAEERPPIDGLAAACPGCGSDAGESCRDAAGLAKPPCLARPWMANSTLPRADLRLSDCVAGMQEVLAPESIDLIACSPPFEELFSYSGKPEDVGNNGSTVDIRAGRFALNCRFVAAGMFRVLRPGTLACLHIQQLLAYVNQHGFMGRRDFRGAMIDVWGAAGFLFAGEFVIPKDPQAMAQRLNLHSLQFKTGYARNGCLLAPAVNDYVLIFRKPGEHPFPPKPLRNSKNPRGWVGTDEWVRDASGLWSDINEFDILDGARGHKEAQHEKHVCALQLEILRRLVRLYTNPVGIQPDVRVLDPFGGIGSAAFVCVGGKSPLTGLAVEEPRNVVTFELKESYHRASLDYVGRALAASAAAVEPRPDLFAGVPAVEDRP